MILKETYDLLRTKYIDQIENLLVTDVRIGLFLTAIRLSSGSCGIAGNLKVDMIHGDKQNRDFGEYAPTRIRGNKVMDLIETEKKTPVISTLKLAALNAVSSQIMVKSGYKIHENMDPVDLLDLESARTITLVGGFQSYIRKISGTSAQLYVLEFDKNALKEDQQRFFVPAENYVDLLPQSDIVIITGLTLVNNTIDGLLQAVKPGAQVVVTGPSANIIPDVLFHNNVTMIGATRILDPDLLFTVVGEAGAGYHLFERCAQKITILNKNNNEGRNP
jgi:uncharacterized protein